MRIWRLAKAEASLLIAAADIGGVWDLDGDHAGADAGRRRRGRGGGPPRAGGSRARDALVVPDPAQPEVGSGYFVLALGKMGAHELNYSSDIDLIVLFDPTSPAVTGTEPGMLFVRMTRGSSSCCRNAPSTAMCFASMCGCGRIRRRPRSRCRFRWRSTTTSAAVRTGNARR